MQNRKTYLAGTRLDESEKALLLTLAKLEERKPSDMIRRLIRLEGERRGIALGCKQITAGAST